MRLDRFVSEALGVSRSDSRTLIVRGKVLVNGSPARKADLQVTGQEEIQVDGKSTGPRQKFVYVMLNKPEGVVSASRDKRDVTVADLVKEAFPRRELFPAGRLDKTSTGFVLLTDDGGFAHDILAPKRHVSKTYQVLLDTPCTPEMVEGFEKGVTLADGQVMEPAGLIPDREDPRRAVVILHQGVYHQIKRMFGVYGAGVDGLHRVEIGGVALDPSLEPGGWRELTPQEVERIRSRGQSGKMPENKP